MYVYVELFCKIHRGRTLVKGCVYTANATQKTDVVLKIVMWTGLASWLDLA